MRQITVRVDQELAEQLHDLAAAERESTSTIVRRFVVHGLKSLDKDVQSLARAREDTARVH